MEEIKAEIVKKEWILISRIKGANLRREKILRDAEIKIMEMRRVIEENILKEKERLREKMKIELEKKKKIMEADFLAKSELMTKSAEVKEKEIIDKVLVFLKEK